MIELWIGTDVSKKSLDAYFFWGGKGRSRKLANSSQGFAQLLAWVMSVTGPGVSLRFCMESTGDYGVEYGLWLLEMGHQVSVVNPARIYYYGISKGRINKTDRADARLISEYGEAFKPQTWALADADRRELFRLYRRRDQLTGMETAEVNRKECPGAIGAECVGSIKRMLKAIRAELRQIESRAKEIIQGSAPLKEALELIESFPSLGFGSAFMILAEMPPVEASDSAKGWAAASGANPTTRDSGTSVHGSGRISKQGRKRCRAALWMPCLSSLKTMPELGGLYDRLIAKGKHHFLAMTACLRKLLMIVYGVLTHKTPYKPLSAEAKLQTT